jgi:hypothetical protein
MKPLAIDLYCGLGGWTEGLLAEGYDVVGFDIKRHVYGEHRYPGMLVVQDVTTLHGSQLRKAALLVASPPCQKYSYMAMPWTKAKAQAAAIRADTTGKMLEDLNRLFNACFRIQREASEAAGHHIPLIVENVRGAIPWMGRSRWNYGSFYLWGDVPALMPITFKGVKVSGFHFDGNGGSFQSASVEFTGVKAPGMDWSDQTKRGQDFTRIAGRHREAQGVKVTGDWFGSYADMKANGTISPGRLHGKGSKKRAEASAMIAKIPLPLSRYIAATFRPTRYAEAAE